MQDIAELQVELDAERKQAIKIAEAYKQETLAYKTELGNYTTLFHAFCDYLKSGESCVHPHYLVHFGYISL